MEKQKESSQKVRHVIFIKGVELETVKSTLFIEYNKKHRDEAR